MVAVLAWAAVVRVGLVVNLRLDFDESQHLHAAWRVAEGQVPYRDFWEHHVPLLYYALVPLLRWCADRASVYLWGRAAMCLATATALVMVFRLARRVSREAALAAVLLLLVLPEFAENGTEIRPDVPALAAWLAALLGLVAWRESPGRVGLLAGAGLALGVALALTLKAVYGVVGVGLAVAGTGALRPTAGRGGGLARAASSLGPLAAGAALPIVALAGWLAWTGGGPGLRGLVDQVGSQNLRFVDFVKTWPATGAGLGFGLLAVLGVGLALAEHGRRVLTDPLHGTALPPLVVITAFLALPRTPAVYAHAWLPVLGIGAVYAGIGLARVAAWACGRPRLGRTLVLGAVVLGAVLVPAVKVGLEAVRDEASPQLSLVRLLLLETCAGEPVLDGSALAVFRPSAHRYGVLITGVREWIAQGVIPEEAIEADLRRAGARVAYPDRRLRGLVGPVKDALEAHYVPGPDGLLVSGASIAVPGGPEGGRARVELLTSGLHGLWADRGIAVAVDGEPRRPGFLSLAPGPHVLTWTGPPGRIRLWAATCRERRAVGAPASGLTTGRAGA